MAQHAACLSSPKYRPDIDGLRAVAVLSVVGFHAFPRWVQGGFTGVDIFFVISGFLITTVILENLERDTFSFRDFYARRIKRIFPALCLVLTVSYVAGWFVLLPNEFAQLGKHSAAGAGFISNFAFWREASYFDNSAETKPLLHLWSLGIEEQFYLVWPLLLWLAWKKKLNILTITLLIASASFYLNLKGIRKDPVATFYSPQTRFWELLCGGVLAWMTLYKGKASAAFETKLDGWLTVAVYRDGREADGTTLANLLAFGGCFLLLYGCYGITKAVSFPGKWAVLPVVGTAMIIAAGPKAWLNRAVLSHRVLVWFGLISFPFYLWHWPLLSFARIIEHGVPGRSIRIAAVIISVVLAWLTYRFIERPVRIGTHAAAKTYSLIVFMLCVGCVGYVTYNNGGFPSRFPAIIRELTQYKYDYASAYREGSCFLKTEQDYKHFVKCTDEILPGKETLFLWGDSHAAHLYPGYKKIYGNRYNIIQRNAAACIPILGTEVPTIAHCKKINDHVYSTLKALKPERVVLSAAWTLKGYDISKLEETIQSIKSVGVTRIDLVGPVPVWHEPLAKQLYTYFLKSIPHEIPYRMRFGLDQSFAQKDTELRNIALKNGIHYVSPKDILCNEDGCMTRFGETGDTLVSWDGAHLTTIGSIYLVSKFPGY